MKKLIETYIQGWLKSDKEQILSVLDDRCEIIESHGPRYQRKETISRWIDDWFSAGGKVTRWEITSLYESGKTTFFEWQFECDHQSKHHSLEGASISKVNNNKISHLREYRATKAVFDWWPVS